MSTDSQGARPQGYLMVVAASCLWGASGLFSSLIFDSGLVKPRDLAAARVYGAAVLLLPLVLRRRPRLGSNGWLRVAAFGVFGVSVPQWVYFESIARIPVPIALVIVYTAPVLVTLYERVVRQLVFPVGVYLLMVLSVMGVIVAVTGGVGGAGRFQVLGVVLAVITAFAYALQILVAASQPTELPPLVRTGLGMLAGSLFWMLVAPWWLLPWSAANQQVDLGSQVSGSAPVGLLAVGIIVLGTVVPYTLLVAGSPRIGLGASSVTGMIEPVFASLVAWIALGQRLTILQFAGVAVALASVTGCEVLRYRQ